MNDKYFSLSKKIFYSMVLVFVLIVIYFVIPLGQDVKRGFFIGLAVLGLVFFILGAVLIFTAVKSRAKKGLKVWWVLVGASAVGIPVCVILHNLVYALFILIFGEGFWNGGDEPVFFILGLIFLPVLFIVSSIGAFVKLRKVK
jgi:hypothetical protein